MGFERKHPPQFRIQPDGPYWSVAQWVSAPSEPKGHHWRRLQWFDTLDKAAIALVNRQIAENIEPPFDAPAVIAALHEVEAVVLAELKTRFPEA